MARCRREGQERDGAMKTTSPAGGRGGGSCASRHIGSMARQLLSRVLRGCAAAQGKVCNSRPPNVPTAPACMIQRPKLVEFVDSHDVTIAGRPPPPPPPCPAALNPSCMTKFSSHWPPRAPSCSPTAVRGTWRGTQPDGAASALPRRHLHVRGADLQEQPVLDPTPVSSHTFGAPAAAGAARGREQGGT